MQCISDSTDDDAPPSNVHLRVIHAITSAIPKVRRTAPATAAADSTDDDAPLVTTAAKRASGECDPFTALQCTLSHAAIVRRTTKKEQSSSISDSDVESFDAANAANAKIQLLNMFSRCHVNGHVRCINSRADYVYCKCATCGCTAAVKQSKVDPKRWVVSALSERARQPCSGLAAPAPLPAIPSPSVPVLPLLPLLPVSVIPAVPTATCCSCQDQFQEDVMFTCPNPSAHVLCLECFELNVSSQFGEDILNFVNRNCAIICSFCSSDDLETRPYNMQALIPR